MNEERMLSITKKSLFLKSMLLSVAVFGVVLAHPLTGAVMSGAHKVCQWGMRSAERCQNLCDGDMPGTGNNAG